MAVEVDKTLRLTELALNALVLNSCAVETKKVIYSKLVNNPFNQDLNTKCSRLLINTLRRYYFTHSVYFANYFINIVVTFGEYPVSFVNGAFALEASID